MMRLLLLCAMIPIALSVGYVLWHAPSSRACIHPTEIPATWFGDCNRGRE